MTTRGASIRRRTFLAGASVALLGACADGGRTSAVIASGSASPLASPGRSRVDLDEVLERRRSIRSFTEEPLREDLVSHLLWAAQGVTSSWGGRTAPSAGALYPIEVYVADAEALRRYVPADHRAVEVVGEDRRSRIAAATGGQGAAVGAPVLFVLTAVVERTAVKYGDRAERYAHLEAGHACQNLLLEATALGLGAVPIGAFSDDDLRDAIDAEGGETPLYVVPVGHVAGTD